MVGKITEESEKEGGTMLFVQSHLVVGCVPFPPPSSIAECANLTSSFVVDSPSSWQTNLRLRRMSSPPPPSCAKVASEHDVRTAKSFGAGWHVLCTQSETLFACLDLPLQPGWEIYHHRLSSPSPTLSSPFVPPVSLDINGPTDPTPSLLSPSFPQTIFQEN